MIFGPVGILAGLVLDKGWSRLEKILLILGVSFAWLIAPEEIEGADVIVISFLAFGPWLTAKIIKCIIDGFRSKEDKAE